MKMIALAVLATIVLGAAAAALMGQNNVLAYEHFSTSGTRISKPGSNLVGKDWTGNPKAGEGAGTH